MVRRCGGLNQGRGNTKLDTTGRKKDLKMKTSERECAELVACHRGMATAEGLLGIAGGVRRGSEPSKLIVERKETEQVDVRKGSGLGCSKPRWAIGPRACIGLR